MTKASNNRVRPAPFPLPQHSPLPPLSLKFSPYRPSSCFQSNALPTVCPAVVRLIPRVDANKLKTTPGLSLVGIEPVEAMRKQFEKALPGAQVVDGEQACR